MVPFLDLYDTNDLEITNSARYCTRLGPHLLMRARFLSKHTPISIEVAPLKHDAWCMIHVSWPAVHFGRSFGKVFARLCSATDKIMKTINSCLKVLTNNRKAVKMSFQLKQKPNWFSSASKLKNNSFIETEKLRAANVDSLEIGFYGPPSYLLLSIFQP